MTIPTPKLVSITINGVRFEPLTDLGHADEADRLAARRSWSVPLVCACQRCIAEGRTPITVDPAPGDFECLRGDR